MKVSTSSPAVRHLILAARVYTAMPFAQIASPRCPMAFSASDSFVPNGKGSVPVPQLYPAITIGSPSQSVV